MKKLLIATTNKGKVLEYTEIFKNCAIPVELVTLKDLNINQEVKEDGSTFEENATKKAKFYHNLSKLSTLSDDAGLEIDYLNGEPGVNSRRWPGYRASDEELTKLALEKLEGVPKNKRGAQLRVIVALAFSGEEKIYTFKGVLRGFIAEKPFAKILAGYPFRSIFIPNGSNKYLGELHIVAHRKQAIEKALPLIKKHLC